MENLVKYEEWINTETFEVKSIPQNAVIKGLDWVKIPEGAEFVVKHENFLEFRKEDKYFSDDGKWYQGCWEKKDFVKLNQKIVWERESTIKETVDTCCKTQDTVDTNFIEDRTNIFKRLLQGVKFQYRYNDAGQWHNLTDKSIGHLMKPNVAIREKPQKVAIDGIEMDKDAAIKYIQKHY